MTATIRLLMFITALPLVAHAAAPQLAKDMPFMSARKLLLKERWRPVNIHANDDYALMGVEHELAKKRVKEFDACSIDYSNCVMRYKRGNECLTVYTSGEKIKDMKVVHWSDECARQAQSPAK
jgi:hypothetical protein